MLGALSEEHLDADGGVVMSDEEHRSYFGNKDPVEKFLESQGL